MNNNWAHNEFKFIDLGDQRLNNRLIKLSDDFINSPESPINKSCGDWAATKAAYRFFQNESISYKNITDSHAKATIQRCNDYNTVLTIQDTTYFTYSPHPKTKGLCSLSKNRGKHKKDIFTLGLIMHSTITVSTDGLPLGIIDQKIYSRPSISEDIKKIKKRSHNKALPIEQKDSYRWIESLKNTDKRFKNLSTLPITVCDRESDIFDFFHLADNSGMKVLVRANYNRKVNKSSTYSEVTGKELWPYMKQKKTKGYMEIVVPAQNNQPERKAKCRITFSKIIFSPPHNHPKMKSLSQLSLHAIYISEIKYPKDIDPIDWMLITNIKIDTLDQAVEKIKWYCLRWRIEIFHKILKSGLKVEDCRLETGNRLIRYLSVMSIVAWRIHWLTLISRIFPDLSCLIFLKENEWKILYVKYRKNKKLPEKPPTIKQCVIWIAMLGGFLARKCDNDPGIIHIWRGLKSFAKILEGVSLARDIYG